MKPVDFTKEEAQWLVNAANDKVKANGLVEAQMGINVVSKLQHAAIEDEKPEEPTEAE